jgi:hypothetical protein
MHQTIAPSLKLSICLNLPTSEELDKIALFEDSFSGTTQITTLNKLESVSASMNRCASNFFGFAHAIWNVDDVRTKNSLELQLESLKSGSDLSFGNYICVSKSGEFKGNQVSYSDLTKKHYKERMMGGPFLAFTNAIFNDVGGFDEQFEIASDMDFYLKCLNVADSKVSYIDENLGFYLDEGAGLSTNPKRRKQLAEERLVIRARFPRVRAETFDFGALRSLYVLPHLKFTRQMRIFGSLGDSRIKLFLRFTFYMFVFNTYSSLRQRAVGIQKFLRKLSM